MSWMHQHHGLARARRPAGAAAASSPPSAACPGCSAARPAAGSRCPGQHHGDESALALAAGELVHELVGQPVEVDQLHGPFDELACPRPSAGPRAGSGRTHQVADGQAHGQVVVLAQDGHPLGEFVARGRATSSPSTVTPPASIGSSRLTIHEQRGLAGTVGADDRGDAAGRDLAASTSSTTPRARRTWRRRRRRSLGAPFHQQDRNSRPPANSMTMLSAVSKPNTCSSTSWPPTRATTPSSTATGSARRGGTASRAVREARHQQAEERHRPHQRGGHGHQDGDDHQHARHGAPVVHTQVHRGVPAQRQHVQVARIRQTATRGASDGQGGDRQQRRSTC